MLAGDSEKPFDGKDWLFEIKWDGYRAIAEVKHKNLSLYSRNGISFLQTYPFIAEELRKAGLNAVLDGEIVVLDEEGQPSFQLLQHYSENKDKPIIYYVFDLLEMNGHDTTGLELIQRKELLKELLPENPVIRYSDHILEEGISFFNVSREKNLEGIMAKHIHSNYLPGKRTKEWLKIKHHQTEEAIIAGYTSPAGARKYFGALILAMLQDDELVYIGHTGTGFDQKTLKEMYELLQPLVQDASPFGEKIKTNMPATWVRPELVCEVKFSEKTRDGMLRHPVFLQLRDDKDKAEVVLKSEGADGKKTNLKSARASSNKGQILKSASKSATQNKKQSASGTKPASLKKQSVPARILNGSEDQVLKIGKEKVKVTNPGKIYFPADGITKGDVITYYASMSKYILPYLKGRPESLLRNPNGIGQPGFFHKDAGEIAPSFVEVEKVHSASSRKVIDYILCNNLPTLLYMNNLGCIEINPWHSRAGWLDNPDYLMIDIDPSDKNTFDQVVECALVLKDIFDKAGTPSFCKTSGATGMHVYVPTAKKYSYGQVKDFAYLICMLANQQLRNTTTLERNLKKRGNKHIYLDYLQNRRGQTISCVYSLRPKPGGPVSTPLNWEEVKSGITPTDYNIYNALERTSNVGDLFKGVLGKGIDLKSCLENLSG